MSAIKERKFILVPQETADDLQFEVGVQMLVKQFDFELDFDSFRERISSGKTRVEIVVIEGEVAGAGSYTIYHRDEALSHKMLDVRYDNGAVTALKLSTFGEILESKPDLGFNGEPLVVETDYMVVDKRFRNNGIAGEVLGKQVSELVTFPEVGLVFGMPQGVYSPPPGEPSIFSEKVEEILKSGEWLSAEACYERTGFDVSVLTPTSGRGRMTDLVSQFGFKPAHCLYPTSSPIWVATRQDLKVPQNGHNK